MKKGIIAVIVIVIIVIAITLFSGQQANASDKVPGGSTQAQVSDWYRNYGQKTINHLNGWIRNYTHKWHAGDPEAQKKSAAWQLWENQLKKKGEILSLGLKYSDFNGYNDFLNFLTAEGIMAQLTTM